MPDMFQQTPSPDMSGNNDALFAATQAANAQFQSNLLAQQQQTMLNATQASITPGYYDPMVGGYTPSTISLASNSLAQGMSNVFHGTLAASGQLMQNFSGMGQAANRFVLGSKYQDVYAGPNSFALETSMRRELGSFLGFDHTTTVGRLLLGGFRPDFLTEATFKSQMNAALESRFSNANLVSGGLTALGAAAMFTPIGLAGGLIAAPTAALTSRLINSTESMYVDREQKEGWARRVNLRFGYGAEGYMDKATSYGVDEGISQRDMPSYGARFLGKNLARKFGLAPEIQMSDVNKSMEDLGMFSIRQGAYDKDKVLASVKAVADQMKDLAAIAKVLKEDIPKAAAELQRAGGFTYNQSNQYMSLVKQAAITSGVTGISLDKVIGAQSAMMQLGVQNGFSAMGTGMSVTDIIQQGSALKVAGLIGQSVDPVNFAQNMQIGMMQNQRTNIFAQMKPGESAGDFQDRIMKDPKSYWTNKNDQINTNQNAFEKNVQTIKQEVDMMVDNNPTLVDDQIGRTNLAYTIVKKRLPNLSFEEQQAIVMALNVTPKARQQLKNKELVLARDKDGTLAAIAGSKEKAAMLVDQANSIPRMSAFINAGGSGNYKRESMREDVLAPFGGSTAFTNKILSAEEEHINLMRQGGSRYHVTKTEAYKEFMVDEMLQNGGDRDKAHKKALRIFDMNDEETKTYIASAEGIFGNDADLAKRVGDRIAKGQAEGEATEVTLQSVNKMSGMKGKENVNDFIKKVVQQRGLSDRFRDLAGTKGIGANKFEVVARQRTAKLIGMLGGQRELDTIFEAYGTESNDYKYRIGWKHIEKAYVSMANMTTEQKIEFSNRHAKEIAKDMSAEGIYADESTINDIRRALLSRSGAVAEIKAQQFNTTLAFGSKYEKEIALFSKLASGRKDRWTEGVITGKEKAGYSSYINKFGSKMVEQFNAIYEAEKEKNPNNAFGIAQAKMSEIITTHLLKMKQDGSIKDDPALEALADRVIAKGNDVGKAILTMSGKDKEVIDQLGAASDKDRKSVFNTYRTLTTDFHMSDDDIQTSLSKIKASKYSGFVGSGKQFTSDVEMKGFTDLVSSNKMLSAVAQGSETLSSDIKEKLKKGESVFTPTETKEIQAAVENVGKIGGIDANGLDLEDKKTSAEAVSKMNDLLGAIVQHLGITPTTSTEKDKKNNPYPVLQSHSSPATTPAKTIPAKLSSH